jgi:predicted DNA-binding WGR domain protein
MPRYEFSEGGSNKFWEISREGSSFTTTYGKIGTKGQTTQKSFPDEEKAKREYDKLIAEKVKKGYQLVGEAEAAAKSAQNPMHAWPKCFGSLTAAKTGVQTGWPRFMLDAFEEEEWNLTSDRPIRIAALLGTCSTGLYPDCPNLPEHHRDALEEGGPDELEHCGGYEWFDSDLVDAGGAVHGLRTVYNFGFNDANDGPWGEIWLRDTGEKVADIVAVDDYVCRVSASPDFIKRFKPYGHEVPALVPDGFRLAVPRADPGHSGNGAEVELLLFAAVLLHFFNSCGEKLEWEGSRQKKASGPALTSPPVRLAGSANSFPSLDAALAAAADGATLLLASGDYQVTPKKFSKKVFIEGTGPRDTIVIKPSKPGKPTFEITGGVFSFKQITLGGERGLSVSDGSVVLEDCALEATSAWDIWAEGPTSSVTLTGCVVHHSKGEGLLAMSNQAQASLKNCRIEVEGNAQGVQLMNIGEGCRVDVEASHFRMANPGGIFIDWDSRGRFEKSSFTNIELGTTGRLDVVGCTFHGGIKQLSVAEPTARVAVHACELSGSRVALSLDGGVSTIENTRISACEETGIESGLTESGEITVRGCTITGCPVGVRARNGKGKLTLEKCTFENNKANIQMDEGAHVVARDNKE